MPTTRSRRGTKPRARRRYWSHTVKTVQTYPAKGLFAVGKNSPVARKRSIP